MRVAAHMFGGYHVAVYGGGIAVTVTAPNGQSIHLQGEESAMLCDEFETALSDIAQNGNTRFARIGERAAASEILGIYFDGFAK